jgi:hypothetical protein
MNNKILKKVNEILDLDYPEFCEMFPDNPIGTGERTCDYVEHFVQLDEVTFLLISFVDFDLHSFSIIDKRDVNIIVSRHEELFS